MRIQTQNKLAHLQCEYQSLSNQTAILQGQLSALNAELVQYNGYNGGDRTIIARYRTLNSQAKTLNSQINRNINRLNRLQMSINTEIARLNGCTVSRRRYY
jgi:chaperonin cofactor prefoldin